jgi:hypothetical protein
MSGNEITRADLAIKAASAGMIFRDLTTEEIRARGTSANCALFRGGAIVVAYVFPPSWDPTYRMMTQQCIQLVADDIRRIVSDAFVGGV